MKRSKIKTLFLFTAAALVIVLSGCAKRGGASEESGESRVYESGGAYTINEYDSSGRITEEKHYDSDGVYTGLTSYEYTAEIFRSELYKVTELDASGEVREVYEYTNGYVAKHTFFKEGYSESFEYDQYGRLIKLSTFSGEGVLLGYTVYENDKNGVVTKITNYDGEGNILPEKEPFGDE